MKFNNFDGSNNVSRAHMAFVVVVKVTAVDPTVTVTLVALE
jgi:hypothetical protein